MTWTLMRDRSGAALTEFALILPMFLAARVGGIEVANYALQTLRVASIAAQIADNASRIGDYSTLENRKIYEGHIDDLFTGADLEAGSNTALFANGRVIISSLEVNAASGKQYIHWQRCMGARQATSSYGVQGSELSAGMGPAGHEVTAQKDEAVMFVEVQYAYQPLIGSSVVGHPTIASIASFTVRSSRDLSQIYQRAPADPVMTCNKFTSTLA